MVRPSKNTSSVVKSFVVKLVAKAILDAMKVKAADSPITLLDL